MNTKQTPEQAATGALLSYSEEIGEKHAAARQSIIKAFQDWASLLEACEYLIKSCDTAKPRELMRYIAESWEKARAAIAKAKA